MTASPPTRVYFDTSAFSALWPPSTVPEPSLEEVRRRLVSPLWEHRPTIIMSVTLLDELAAAHEGGPRAVARLREQMELLDGCRLMMPWLPEDCVRDEVQGLPGCWADPDYLGRLLVAVVKDPALVAEERARFKAGMAAWVQDEEEARKALLEEMGGQAAHGAEMDKWARHLKAHVDEWCRDDMRRNASAWRLPSDEAKWPDPRTLPTLWAFTSFKLARIALVNRDGRKPRKNDLPDQDHYVFAAHADVFITNDGGLREIIDLCPAPKPRVVTLAEWVREVMRQVDTTTGPNRPAGGGGS